MKALIWFAWWFLGLRVERLTAYSNAGMDLGMTPGGIPQVKAEARYMVDNRLQQEIREGVQPARFFAERGVLLPPAPVEPPVVVDDGILVGRETPPPGCIQSGGGID